MSQPLPLRRITPMCDCDPHPYDVFLEEYLASDPHNRIDMITTTFNVNGLLICVNNHVCVLSHLRLNRSAEFESTKEVTGVTGNRDDFFTFRVDAAQVTANFASWVTLPSDSTSSPVPDIVDQGKPVKKFLAKQKKSFDAEGKFLTDLSPSDKLPSDDTVDLLPVFSQLRSRFFADTPTWMGVSPRKVFSTNSRPSTQLSPSGQVASQRRGFWQSVFRPSSQCVQ